MKYLLLVVGVGVGALVLMNLKRCQGGAMPADTNCANGQSLGASGGTCAPASGASEWINCLTSFTGGYQGGF